MRTGRAVWHREQAARPVAPRTGPTSSLGAAGSGADTPSSEAKLMAFYPCDVGSHRYSGRQQAIYPAVAHGSRTSRRKLRLCPQHFLTIFQEVEQHMKGAQADFEDLDPPTCGNCGREVLDSEYVLFMTVYADGSDRSDYWAPLHADCVEQMLVKFRLPPLA